MTKAFASMPGAEILSYVRDIVANAAVTKRSFAEQSAAVGGVRLNDAELAELAALEAAADVIQVAVSAGQEAKRKGKPAPEWVLKMVTQARVALVAEKDEASA